MGTKTKITSVPRDRTIALNIEEDGGCPYTVQVAIPKAIQPKHWRKFLFTSLQHQFGWCVGTDYSGWNFNSEGTHVRITIINTGTIETTEVLQFQLRIG